MKAGRDRRTRIGGIAAGSITLLALIAGGCSTPGRVPMEVLVTQLGPYANPAKGPECNMPVLNGLPLTSYREIAIVEAWADIKDDPDDVIPGLKRQACETGADALVILNSQHQDIKHFLYQASPNESLTESTQKDVYAGQGEYIKEAEHTRRVGEAGHNGLYVNAVAINYTVATTKPSSPGPADVLSHPNG